MNDFGHLDTVMNVSICPRLMIMSLMFPPGPDPDFRVLGGTTRRGVKGAA